MHDAGCHITHHHKCSDFRLAPTCPCHLQPIPWNCRPCKSNGHLAGNFRHHNLAAGIHIACNIQRSRGFENRNVHQCNSDVHMQDRFGLYNCRLHGNWSVWNLDSHIHRLVCEIRIVCLQVLLKQMDGVSGDLTPIDFKAWRQRIEQFLLEIHPHWKKITKSCHTLIQTIIYLKIIYH